jgi:SOS-response transcriptional repressor LexA/transcriptional regulator with XRE-family HTH domain
LIHSTALLANEGRAEYEISEHMSTINSESSKYPGLIFRIEGALGTSKTSEIARLLEVSSSLVSDWRAGRSIPALSQLLKAAQFGHTTIDWLLTGIGPRTLTLAVDNEDTELLNLSERAFIEGAVRRSKEPITRTLRSLIQDGLAARGYIPYAVDVIQPVLSCLDAFPRDKRTRIAELLTIALSARLCGRVDNWSLRPDEWRSISDISSEDGLGDAEIRGAVRKLTRALSFVSATHTKGRVFAGSNVLVFGDGNRAREIPLVGEVTRNGTVKLFRVPKTAKVPDVFPHHKGMDYCALRVRGDSLTGDGISEGNLMVYERRTDASDGQMILAARDGRNAIQWFHRDGSGIRLQPLDPHDAPLYVKRKSQLDVQGVFVGMIIPHPGTDRRRA